MWKKPSQRTDEELMRMLQRGQQRAFDELYHRYSQVMFAFFWRKLNENQALAEDFTQQLFLKLVEKVQMFDPTRSLRTWLYTLAGNMVKNEYRRRSRHRPEMLDQLPEPILNTQHILAHLDQQFWQTQLQHALAQLDPKHRRCFELRYLEELSIKEISVLVQCPEGTVKSRLFYAIKKLAGYLKAVRNS